MRGAQAKAWVIGLSCHFGSTVQYVHVEVMDDLEQCITNQVKDTKGLGLIVFVRGTQNKGRKSKENR